MSRNRIFFHIFLVGAVMAIPAFAYVDPNTTGLIGQVLGPVLIVAAAGLTFLRKQIGAGVQWLTGRRPLKK